MKCMYCGETESKVIDSRATEDGAIRRRRECLNCGRRFTTYETVVTSPVLVVKSNGTRQAFDPEKIRSGIVKACEKRPVPAAKIEKLVDDVSKKVYNSLNQEISSKEIGEIVMDELKNVDEVAYIRFASVYRSFADVSSFMSELQKMVGKKD